MDEAGNEVVLAAPVVGQEGGRAAVVKAVGQDHGRAVGVKAGERTTGSDVDETRCGCALGTCVREIELVLNGGAPPVEEVSAE